jgi:TRAP-type C4-dicarboxylate transport system permease small subunit
MLKIMRSILQQLFIVCGGIALMVMMLHITAEVVLRSLFHITIPGTIEFVSVYYMVVAVFVGLAMVQLVNEQVIVEIFLQWMTTRQLFVVDAFGATLTAGYAGFLAYGAWLEARSATRFGEMVPVRGFDLVTRPSRWVAVAALALMALFALIQAIGLFAGRRQESE